MAYENVCAIVFTALILLLRQTASGARIAFLPVHT